MTCSDLLRYNGRHPAIKVQGLLNCYLAAVIPYLEVRASLLLVQPLKEDCRWSLESLLQDSDRFRRQLTTLKNLYAVSKIVNVIGDGTRPYPDATEEKSKGMAFELR